MWLPLTFIIVGAAWYLNTQRLTTSCRCIPESTCWPSLDDWIVFNKSVNGHVFALRPVAWPCSSQGYDEVQCAEVIRQFHNSSWRAQHAAASQLINWEASAVTHEGCTIENHQAPICLQGRVPSYTVRAHSVEDVQKTVRFARERNIRLLIRNTGHDLGGRSSGPGALQLDVSGLNNIVRSDFEPLESGQALGGNPIPAVTVGGGTRMGEVYELGALESFTIAGGGSSSVGLAGGFVQTGGMSILSPSHGLSSDNVLEFELVVANGSVVVANEHQNSDLFWACRGGGGGTFGVVTRMTLRIFPDTPGRVVRLTYDGVGQDPQLWSLVEEGLGLARKLNEAGHSARLISIPVGFTGNASLTFEAVLLGKNTHETYLEFERLKALLGERGTSVQVHNEIWPSIAKYLAEGLGPDPAGVGMLPASILVSTQFMNTSDGSSRITKVLSKLPFQLGDAVSMDVWCGRGVNSNFAQSAVSPALRSSLMSLTVARGIPPGGNGEALEAARSQIESVDLPNLLALEPGRTGISPAFGYPYDEQFADHFWGSNYPQLRDIKQRWDPDSVFLTRLGVGSEDWDDECLCLKQNTWGKLVGIKGALLQMMRDSPVVQQVKPRLEAIYSVLLK